MMWQNMKNLKVGNGEFWGNYGKNKKSKGAWGKEKRRDLKDFESILKVDCEVKTIGMQHKIRNVL